MQVHRSAIGRVVTIYVFISVLLGRSININILLTYEALVATAEYLEAIAVVVVHSSAAPYIGVSTMATTEHCHCQRVHIVALSEEVNIGISWIKYIVHIDYVLVEVDDDVTVNMSAVVASTVYITVNQAALIFGIFSIGMKLHVFVLVKIPLRSVPLKFGTQGCQLVVCIFSTRHFGTIGNELGVAHVGCVIFLTSGESGTISNLSKRIVPALGLDGEVVEVDFQTVLNIASTIGVVGTFLGTTEHTTPICSVQSITCRHIGIVTTAHQFLEDDQTTVESVSVLARNSHTTHITTAEERAYPT